MNNARAAEGFKVFARYEPSGCVSSDHDIIWAGPDPSKVHEDDLKRLEEIGWLIDTDYDCFMCHT